MDDCVGELKDGTPVAVHLPFKYLSNLQDLRPQIVHYARQAGVFAKHIGILDSITLN